MKRWYVVQVYTGFEDLVRADLKKRIIEENLEEVFGEVIVPTSEALENAVGEAPQKKEKIFPGYLLVQMEMTGEAYRLVSSTPRVTRFLGGASPVALSDAEAERVFAQMKNKHVLSTDKTSFVVGDQVHITSGPFAGFDGVIEHVDDEHKRLTVMVSIFGRLTPIENVGFDQIKQ
jgi:transcriptional antiterminator NusG